MLVGREDEWGVIDRLVTGARVGESGALVLTGEPGIGKSALLEHAAARAGEMAVLRAVGSDSERGVAFAGLLQLVRPVLGVVGDLAAPQAEALSVALALREGGAGDRFAIGAATLSLLSRCAEDRPLLLLLDDTQDLDRPSLEALVFAARRLLTDRVALLAATRPETGPDGPLSALPHLQLQGLPLDPAATLLSLGRAVPLGTDLVRRLHEATAGNPLALLELADDVEVLDRLSPEVPLPVSDALAGAYRRRCAQLSGSAQAGLLLAAVAGGDLAVVNGAAGALSADPADLVEAEDAGLVRIEAGRVVFRHPVVRSSVYAAAPPSLRGRAHRAVAAALPVADLERRTWHLSEATVGFDDSLAADLVMVGERARNRSAYDVAATAQERAALLTSDHPERARRLVTAAESAWLAGQAERAGALLDSAATLTRDPWLLATVDGLRGSIAANSGSLESARDMLTDAARRLAERDPELAAGLLADAVITCLWMADTSGALAARVVLDRLDRRQLDEHGRMLAALATGIAQILAGGPGIDEVRDAVGRLDRLEPRAADPRRPASPMIGVLFLRESDVGRKALYRLLGELRSRAALATLPGLLLQIARDEATTDKWVQGVTHYEEGIALAREAGLTTDLTVGLAGLSFLHARMGREPECRRVVAEALSLADRYDVHLARLWSTFALGDLELGLGRTEQAADHYAALTDMLARHRFRDVDISPAPEHAEALARLGRTEEANRLADSYHADAEEKGQPWARARAERVLGILGDGDYVEAHFDAALELHLLSPDRYEEARTRLAYGSTLRRRRHRVAARPLLRSAIEQFERIGAVPWAELAASELAAAGERPVRRGQTPLTRLTSQELQVSRMLADGRTTREAAAALFLSPKTVEYHLRNVYTKLDIHSRAELAEVLAPGDGDLAT
jgi:DNA-binding CsgD family transcriptional regulator